MKKRRMNWYGKKTHHVKRYNYAHAISLGSLYCRLCSKFMWSNVVLMVLWWYLCFSNGAYGIPVVLMVL